jgi:hypothetical protein
MSPKLTENSRKGESPPEVGANFSVGYIVTTGRTDGFLELRKSDLLGNEQHCLKMGLKTKLTGTKERSGERDDASVPLTVMNALDVMPCLCQLHALYVNEKYCR